MSSFISERPRRLLDTSVPVTFLDAPENADAIALYNYWDSKRGERTMPDRHDISPSDFVRLLPAVGILEVIGGGADFRFRLYGSELVSWTGCDRTGQLFSEIEPAADAAVTTERLRKRWFEVGLAALAVAKPIFVTAPLVENARDHLTMHGVILPMTAGGSEIEQLLGGAFVTSTPAGD